MPSRPMLHRGHYVFTLSVAANRLLSRTNIFMSGRKNTERISMKFAGDNRYQKQIK